MSVDIGFYYGDTSNIYSTLYQIGASGFGYVSRRRRWVDLYFGRANIHNVSIYG